METRTLSSPPPFCILRILPTYLHMDKEMGPTKHMNTQDSNSPTTISSCQHPDLPCPNPSHLTRAMRRGIKRELLLTLKGSELLSSPEEEKRRGRVFDAEVQTEKPENNQRGSGGDRRLTGPPSHPITSPVMIQLAVPLLV